MVVSFDGFGTPEKEPTVFSGVYVKFKYAIPLQIKLLLFEIAPYELVGVMSILFKFEFKIIICDYKFKKGFYNYG